MGHDAVSCATRVLLILGATAVGLGCAAEASNSPQPTQGATDSTVRSDGAEGEDVAGHFDSDLPEATDAGGEEGDVAAHLDGDSSEATDAGGEGVDVAAPMDGDMSEATDASDDVADTEPEVSDGAPVPLSIRVEGNQLVDGSGKRVVLHGVSHSGTEFRCIQGWGIFDGDADDKIASAMATWKINSVRVPLNEDCWLDINGVKPAYGGAAYRSAIENWVKLLHGKGFYVILELHLNAPGAFPATTQQPMVDLDHGPAFWKSVATTFKDDPAVLFDLYNEPYLDGWVAITTDPWGCWRDGCSVFRSRGTVTGVWQAAGMQVLVDAVRGVGAKQPIMLGGLDFANSLTGWLSHKPKDPLNSLVASLHVYNFKACKTESCWNDQVAPVAKEVPLVTGEIGEDDCAHGFIDSYMKWADARSLGYLGWTWNSWGATPTTCGSTKVVLIADWAGTPTPYGAGLRTHLLGLP